MTRHRPRRPPLVTLTSDLGAAYAAQMKAVLLRSLDPAQVVELSHDLPAHGIAEAAFVVRSMAHGFPSGSIHLVVVDPGVGGRRHPVAIACRDGSALVGPDNGVLDPLARLLGVRGAYLIEPARLGTGPRIGTTFDGRDLFAPAAIALARGAPARDLGPTIRPRRLTLPSPVRRPFRLEGQVVHVDHFGNLITNVPTDWIPRGTTHLRVGVGRRRHRVPWSSSYEGVGSGRLGALGSSFGTVEVAVGVGRAADRLRVRSGVRVTVLLEDRVVPRPLRR